MNDTLRGQVLAIVEQLEEFQVSAASELGIDEDGVPFIVMEYVSGGTLKHGAIEIQGEHRDAVLAELQRRGFDARRSGG